jgi:hypothetical protein
LELIFAYYGAILAGAIPSIMPFLTREITTGKKYQQDFQSLVKIIPNPKPSLLIKNSCKVFVDNSASNCPVHSMLLCRGRDRIGRRTVTSRTAWPDACIPGYRYCCNIPALPPALQKGSGALTHQAVFHELEHYSKAILLAPQKDCDL